MTDFAAPDAATPFHRPKCRPCRPRSTAGRVQRIITGVVIAAAVGFIFAQLHPSLLFANTTAAGGDMGAHVWTPAYLRDHLLPHGRLTGWAPDWYGGFPALTFYFPLPSLLIVLGDLLLPYNVAFKLISVSGLLTLPIATWFFARSMKLSSPGRHFWRLATVPFVFDRSFTIYGGNIASTLAGEFSFSMSLSVAWSSSVCSLACSTRASTRRWTAAALAVTGLCHIIPAFFVIAGAAGAGRDAPVASCRSRRAVPVFAVAGLLAGFWVIPFALRLPYTNDMGWEKLTDYRHQLFPSADRPSSGCSFAWAALGLVMSVGRRSRTGLWVAAMAALAAVGFILAPQSRLWNARLLPFWFFSLYLLAGVAATELALGASWLLRELRKTVIGATASDAIWTTSRRCRVLLAPLLALVYVAGARRHAAAAAAVVDDRVKTPIAASSATGAGGTTRATSARRVTPSTTTSSTTMGNVGKRHGCGRAMWEYEPELDRIGTPMALMLLPYWTDGCIDSMEGSLLRVGREHAVPLPQPVRTLGASVAPAARPALHRTQRRRGCEVTCRTSVCGTTWRSARRRKRKPTPARPRRSPKPSRGPPPSTRAASPRCSRVRGRSTSSSDSALVEPLTNLPAVMTKVPKGGREWQNAAVAAYTADGAARRVVRGIWPNALAAGHVARGDAEKGAREDREGQPHQDH